MPADHTTDEQDIDDTPQTVVIDNGSAYTRINFETEDEPFAYKTIISKQSIIDDTKMDLFRQDVVNNKNDKQIIKLCKSSNLPITGSKQDMINRLVDKYINDNYITTIGKYDPDNSKILHSIHPVEFGEITNWEYMEKIWYHGFHNILNINPSDYNVFLSDCLTSPNCSRIKTTNIMFEQFNINSMYLGYNGVLSLYSCGKLNGIAVDCGYQQIQIIPVNEGFSVKGTCFKIGYGGKHVSGYLKKLLLENNPIYNNYTMNWDDVCNMKRANAYCSVDTVDKERVKPSVEDGAVISGYLRSIKRNYSKYTSMDIENLCNKYGNKFREFVRYNKRYKLPDGNMVEFADEHFQCTEMMFNPKLIGLESEYGLHEMIIRQITMEGNNVGIDNNEQMQLLKSVVLCGGNSMFPGMKQRLKKELYGLLRDNQDQRDMRQTQDFISKVDINVLRHEKGAISNWIGGTIFCSLTSFKEMWIDKEEYKEFGANIVHRKCF